LIDCPCCTYTAIDRKCERLSTPFRELTAWLSAVNTAVGPTGSVFAFAGLWDRWLDPKNNIVETCTILTTQPNSLVADVHDRMPAILRVEDYAGWLDSGVTDAKTVLDCLKPFDAGQMKKYPVSSRVNRPENDDEECAREVPIEKTAMTLF